jgi:adenylate kinase
VQDQLSYLRDWLDQGSINIFGMPFAGKDTQGGVLADLFDAELMGGGHILRNSIIPPEIKAVMDAGDLIPTDDYLRIVLPYLSHERFQGRRLLLSSVGRWHGEEQGVLQATKESGHPTKAVILLTVSEDVSRARHALAEEADRGKRADDSEEVFANRLNEYRQKTVPVIDFYRDKGLLIEVDGDQTPVEVTNDIIHKLHAFAKQSSDTKQD